MKPFVAMDRAKERRGDYEVSKKKKKARAKCVADIFGDRIP